MLTKISATGAAVTAVLNALVLLDIIELSSEAIASVNVAVVLVATAIHAFFNPNIPFGVDE